MRFLPNPKVNDTHVSFAPKPTFKVKPVGLVVEALNVEYLDAHRSSKYSQSNYSVHVSDLMKAGTYTKFCARQYTISLSEGRGETIIQKIPPGMRLLHTIGHAVQDHVTNGFLANSPYADKVWGDWICRCGNTKVCYRFKPIKGEYICIVCKQEPSIYQEPDITLPKYNLVGHPDLLVIWGDKLHIYEIKTIDRKGVDFALLDQPLGDHTLQGSLYYWIMKSMYLRDRNREYPASVPYDIDPMVNYVYVDRSNNNLFGRTFYKEFTKRASPLSRIEPIMDGAKQLKEALASKVLPPRLSICKTIESPRAKQCECAVTCFSRQKEFVHAKTL